jgi:micrococcal nuclease
MQDYEAYVTNIVDGDTIDCTVKVGFHFTGALRFRLLGIDTPEIRGKKRKEGLRAKYFLSNLILDSEIKLYSGTTQDSFGRWLALVYKNIDGAEICINEVMVNEGYAIPYIRSVMEDKEKLEQAVVLIEDVIANMDDGQPIPPPDNPTLPPESQWRFKACNLWKPEGDHSGKLVVLIRGDWDEPEYAEAKRRDGSWERLEYTGESNECSGNLRYTYRGKDPGGPAYAGVQKDGGVRLKYGPDFAFIPLHKKPSERNE